MFKTILSQITEELLRAAHAAKIDLESDLIYNSLSFCDIEFGDFSSNLALVSAKKLGVAPPQLAQKLAEALPASEIIQSVSVAGPGFLNIRLNDKFLSTLFDTVQRDYFVSGDGQGKKVNVEFISANPTGPLVLVNAWGGYYGDILARVYQSQGYQVTREYYLNDGGNQIAQLGRAVQQAAGKEFSAEESAELYRGDYIDALAQRFIKDYGSADQLLAAEPQEVGDKAQAIIFTEMIQPTLKRLGIVHEVVTPETSLNNQATLARLEEKQALVERDGAVWLDKDAVSLDQDEVLVRSTDKQETYFLKDITYQLGKLEDRNFDKAITIVGPDHHGQEKRLLAALHLLGADGFVPLWTQTVRLTKNGEEFKMSKRRGNYIVLDDFLDEVPSQTARFFFALRDTNSHLDLDLDMITHQNKHNPLYYIMYAYVRTQSVLTKAEQTTSIKFDTTQLSLEERRLIRRIAEIDEKIALTTTIQAIHPILHSLIDFAADFHDWYEKNPVLKAEGVVKEQRLAFVQKVAVVLAGTLELIGITPIEKM